MARGARAGGAHGGLVGIGLEPVDQLLEVGRGEIGLAEQDERRIGEQHDRLEIVHDVVLQRIGNAVGDVRVPDADLDGVAVRGGPRHAAGADAAGRARRRFRR